MLSEQCVGVAGRGIYGVLDGEMSTLSMKAPGLQAATTLLDVRTLRLRGFTTSLDTVRRNLFGCVDKDENRRFLEREAAHQLEINNQLWGFDFSKEAPLPGTHRYAWEIVPASTVPKALRNATTMTVPKPATPAPDSKTASPEPSKTQKRITGKISFGYIILILVFRMAPLYLT